jgi:hypothetical protein
MAVLNPRERPADEPWLVYRDPAADGAPAIHVLIAGVSDYPNLPAAGEPGTEKGLGMRRLSSTSFTAYLMLDWLLRASAEGRLSLPLGSVRLLLSPTEQECAASVGAAYDVPPIPELATPACSLQNFLLAAERWRESAKARRDAATLFYFAGHGIQRGGKDQLLLMDSFGLGGPLAQHAVDLSSMRNGMAPHSAGSPWSARPDIARTQFYFVDACRSTPRDRLSHESLSAMPVFDVAPTDTLDDRCAPVFYAALPNGVAQALPGRQTLFSIALLRCLAGEAAEAPDDETGDRRAVDWHVSAFSLLDGLTRRLEEVNREYGGQQISIADGFSEDVVLCYLSEPPDVPIRIEIEPTRAVGSTRVLVRPWGWEGAVEELDGSSGRYPYLTLLRAGQYQFAATVQPPVPELRDYTEQFLVAPLGRRVWRARMADG